MMRCEPGVRRSGRGGGSTHRPQSTSPSRWRDSDHEVWRTESGMRYFMSSRRPALAAIGGRPNYGLARWGFANPYSRQLAALATSPPGCRSVDPERYWGTLADRESPSW